MQLADKYGGYAHSKRPLNPVNFKKKNNNNFFIFGTGFSFEI